MSGKMTRSRSGSGDGQRTVGTSREKRSARRRSIKTRRCAGFGSCAHASAGPDGACRPRRRRRRRTRGRSPNGAKRANTPATLARTTTKPKRQGPSNCPNGPSTIRLHSCLCVACLHTLYVMAQGGRRCRCAPLDGHRRNYQGAQPPLRLRKSRTHPHIRHVSTVVPARHGVGCTSIETACRSRLARLALVDH